jgi:cytochrome c oxidase assembly protein subunit 15
LYKQIPQYELVNHGMTLAGFKQIFWLEWVHRLWGRLIGVVFLVPLVVLGLRGAIGKGLWLRLAGLFVLGGLQGAVGWFMVASGFEPDSTAVSPYRLVIHLALALALFAGVFWTALSTLSPIPESIAYGGRLRRLAMATVCFIALTIVAGGFTAGLHAGLEYNTFPLMDGRLVPAGYLQPGLHPLLRNLAENVTAVQFDHRLLASVTVLLVLATVAFGLRQTWRDRLPQSAQFSLALMAASAATQYLLGVATLLSVVALPLAVAHQACAVLLLASALAVTHNLRGAR